MGKIKEDLLKSIKAYDAAKEREARWEELYGGDPNYLTIPRRESPPLQGWEEVTQQISKYLI